MPGVHIAHKVYANNISLGNNLIVIYYNLKNKSTSGRVFPPLVFLIEILFYNKATIEPYIWKNKK